MELINYGLWQIITKLNSFIDDDSRYGCKSDVNQPLITFSSNRTELCFFFVCLLFSRFVDQWMTFFWMASGWRWNSKQNRCDSRFLITNFTIGLSRTANCTRRSTKFAHIFDYSSWSGENIECVVTSERRTWFSSENFYITLRDCWIAQIHCQNDEIELNRCCEGSYVCSPFLRKDHIRFLPTVMAARRHLHLH